jgi:hypothetical protein
MEGNIWQNPELSGVCYSRTRNSESECGKRRRTGASDPNRHLSSPACEREIRRGDDTESVTQFEARIAATLTNLAKQGQHVQTLVEAQVAITDVLLKYVITCVVEPPEDALPAARVRARLRYDKLIRAAAKELSNKNRDTLREMVADY